jgi:ABC-type uncharacterized transport system ATPase subunit
VLKVDIEYAGYLDNKQAIRNIHFRVGKGELVGLIGANCGKKYNN